MWITSLFKRMASGFFEKKTFLLIMYFNADAPQKMNELQINITNKFL